MGKLVCILVQLILMFMRILVTQVNVHPRSAYPEGLTNNN
jgi:hypothetical protein